MEEKEFGVAFACNLNCLGGEEGEENRVGTVRNGDLYFFLSGSVSDADAIVPDRDDDIFGNEPDDEDKEVRDRRSEPAMRDLRARVAIVGLILAFPVFMMTSNPRGPSAREAALPILAVEMILVCGLTVAARERVRLAAERNNPLSVRPLTTKAPHRVRPVRGAHVGRL